MYFYLIYFAYFLQLEVNFRRKDEMFRKAPAPKQQVSYVKKQEKTENGENALQLSTAFDMI